MKETFTLQPGHKGVDGFYAGLCAEVLCAGESTGCTGHRQVGLLGASLPLFLWVRKSPSAQCARLLHPVHSHRWSLQRAEAFGYQLAKVVEVALRKKCTGGRHQRWLLQRGSGTAELRVGGSLPRAPEFGGCLEKD